MSASPACVRLCGTGQADLQSIQFLKMIACYVTSLPDKAHLLLPWAPDLVGVSSRHVCFRFCFTQHCSAELESGWYCICVNLFYGAHQELFRDGFLRARTVDV